MPSGYIAAMLLETLFNFIAVVIFIPNIVYFAGSCWLFIRILKDAPTLSKKGTSASTNAGVSNAVDDTELKQRFCKTVQFFSDVKQLRTVSPAHTKKDSIFHCLV